MPATGATPSTYGQYCPIARALDVLGERWSFMIVRDMVVGSTRFNDLARGLPGLSRSLLTKRRRQLERAGIVARDGQEYVLTEAGWELEPIVLGLGQWGARWAFGEPRLEEVDAELLVFRMHTRLDTSKFPGKRHVIHFWFTDERTQYWVVIESGVPSVCHVDPGYEVSVTVRASVRTMLEVWLGRVPVEDAVRSGALVFLGRPALTKLMPEVLRLSPVAEPVAEHCPLGVTTAPS